MREQEQRKKKSEKVKSDAARTIAKFGALTSKAVEAQEHPAWQHTPRFATQKLGDALGKATTIIGEAHTKMAMSSPDSLSFDFAEVNAVYSELRAAITLVNKYLQTALQADAVVVVT